MRIIVCDDEPNFVALLSKLIREYLDRHQIEYSLLSFLDGEELLRYTGDVDVLFLDINLASLNGIEVASELRKTRPDFILVFVSAFMEYAPHGYEVQAFRYLLKNKLAVSFKPCMEAVLPELGINRHSVAFPFVDGPQEIYVDRIIYVESKKHVVFFNTNSQRFPVMKLYSTLDTVQKQLPKEDFTRAHKSYLLNLRYVDNIINYNAHLVNGVVIPVSQKNFAAAKRDFFYYKGRQI